MERIPQGRLSVQTQPESAQRADLVETIEDLKPEVAKKWTPDIAPMPTPEAASLVGGTRALDQLRLAVPKALDPYAAPLLSLRHDYHKASNVVARSSDELSKKLVQTLQGSLDEISDSVLGHMRASLAREHNMAKLLEGMLSMMGEINGRVIGGQEG